MNKTTLIAALFCSIALHSAIAQTAKMHHTPASRNPQNPTWIYHPQDITPPVISCLNGLNANLLATDMVQLYVSDFLLSASDNETPFDQLRFGIRKAGSGNGFPVDNNNTPVGSIVFDCDEQGAQPVELWVMDLAGNTAFCTSSIQIQDGFHHCTTTQSRASICISSGDCLVDEVYFDISGTNLNGNPFSYFNLQGLNCTRVNFPDSAIGTVKPVKDDNPLDGVSMFDLLVIKQHILGQQPFVSPYQYIAADVNGDGQIDGQDTTALRRLILGIYTELPNNTSWRFVRADYQFPTDPLSQPFPETVSFAELSQLDTVRFIPVKIGDVNGSAVCNGFSAGPDLRSVSNLVEAQVLPNPTTGNASFEVTLSRAELLKINLFDASGRQVFHLENTGVQGKNHFSFPASAMVQPGVYYWQLQQGDSVTSGKLVKM